MILGVPVVSSDVGGVHNLLKDTEEGFLYPTLSKEKLTEAVLKVFAMNGTEEQVIMCTAAGEHARKTHDADTNYKRLLEIYADISKNNA